MPDTVFRHLAAGLNATVSVLRRFAEAWDLH